MQSAPLVSLKQPAWMLPPLQTSQSTGERRMHLNAALRHQCHGDAATALTRFSSDIAGGSATAAAEGAGGPLDEGCGSARGVRLRCAACRGASCVLPRSCAASLCGWATAVTAARCCLLELLHLALRYFLVLVGAAPVNPLLQTVAHMR